MTNLKAVVTQLKQERKNLASQLHRVEKAIKTLRGLAGQATSTALRKGRRLSAQARKRISAAQKARWAKWKAGKKG